MRIDLLICHARELLTISSDGRPRRGPAMDDLAIIADGAVAIAGEEIVDVGASVVLLSRHQPVQTLDVSGRVVMPGFVDPHTHLVYAGDRADEFEMRVKGATYMEIMAAGGGIMSTVRATRAASLEQLCAETLPRLRRMLAYGTTTAEVKTGYGLNVADELKMLQAIERLGREQDVELVPTFLGAHAIPSEYRGRPADFVDRIVADMLPAAMALRPAQRPRFCDAFCEEGAFTVDQTRRILERARELGLGLKVHADEFGSIGATRLAVELGAVSADHLVTTPPDEIQTLASSDTIAVALPGTPFGLCHRDYTPGRAIIAAGGALALATDANPGTSPCESMQMMLALACRYMRLTPAEAIVAATVNAAHAIGLGHRVGSLESGKQADLLVLDAPTFRMLPYRYGTNVVETVIKRGRTAVGRLQAAAQSR